jgi:hypothetical protein
MSFTKLDRQEAIFGSFDGMTSTLGVVAGLLVSHSNNIKIITAVIGISVAATIGMGAGQYLSDGKRNLREAIVMAIATLIGCVLPGIPFVFGNGTINIISAIIITLFAASYIGYYRGYKITYSILLIVSAITVLLSILVL